MGNRVNGLKFYIKKYNEPTALLNTTEIKDVPANKKLSLVQTSDQLSVLDEDVIEITLYNITGKKVAGAAGKSINTSSLSSGVYVVSAKFTDGSVVTRKIIKR
jgi:hypothetical protein